MTEATQETLIDLLRELRAVQTVPAEWTIFGSASLLINGVLDREPSDIDVFVSRRVWDALLARPDWHGPKAGDPPILVNDTTAIAIHLFYDWPDIDVPDLIKRSLRKYSLDAEHWFVVIPVEDALLHKKMALKYGSEKVQKHIPDIAVIEEWLDGQAQAAL
jgi:hypothetical protein